VNPIMGCGGCELFPESPRKIMDVVDRAIQFVESSWEAAQAGILMTQLIHEQVKEIKDQPGGNQNHHLDKLTTTNIWQWLTKRPQNMLKLSRRVGGLPENLCAMTTLTGADRQSLMRLEKLKDVEAGSRGLSIRPLWERIPPEDLSLDGIDWVIIGGESGSPDARPFDLTWARELRDHCKANRVACFIKQLGRNPVDGGTAIRLKDSHGGNWIEWPEDLRIREFPAAYYDYRPITKNLKPTRSGKKPKPDKTATGKAMSEEEQRRLKALTSVVKKSLKVLVDTALALAEIKNGKLYREKYKTYTDYCREVHSMSKSYSNNLLKSGRTLLEMTSIEAEFPDLKIPVKESHLRELAKIKDPVERFEYAIAGSSSKSNDEKRALIQPSLLQLPSNRISPVCFEIRITREARGNGPYFP